MARIYKRAKRPEKGTTLDKFIEGTTYKCVKHEKLLLKTHPKFNEKWVQEKIAEDPLILGIGELVLKDQERNQHGAGRLDLLFQDRIQTSVMK